MCLEMSNAKNDFVLPIVVLTVICIVVSLALAFTEQATAPIIAAAEKAAAEAAEREVLPSADSFELVQATGLPVGVTEVYRATNGAGFVFMVEGKGYGDFKLAVAEVTADALAPVQAEYGRILADKAYVDSVLKSGAERAARLANRTVSKVYRKVGLMQLDK